MAQVVSRRALIAEAQVRSQVSTCDTCVRQSYARTGFGMAVRFAQPITEMSISNISWWGKVGPCVGMTTCLPSCADYLASWEPQLPGTHWA
jgi:hypothetical protein